jgi:hypothetical protein
MHMQVCRGHDPQVDPGGPGGGLVCLGGSGICGHRHPILVVMAIMQPMIE